MNRKNAVIPMTFKADGAEQGTFTGMANVANVVDLGGDRILSGAFQGDLKARGPRRPLLWSHKPEEPLGTVDLVENYRGLSVTKGQLVLGVQRAREVYELLKTPGALGGMSIGYEVDEGSQRIERDGTRTITAIKIWEVSLVCFPMNPLSTVDSVKALNDEAAFQRLLKSIRQRTAEVRELRRASMSRTDAALDRLQELTERIYQESLS